MIFKGTVQKGEGSGRKLGFPTANIPLADTAVSGIYAAYVRFNAHAYRAAAYGDQRRKLLEVHILNWDSDLYGTEIEIELVKKIRDDRPFVDAAEATRTIHEDVEAIETYFRTVN